MIRGRCSLFQCTIPSFRQHHEKPQSRDQAICLRGQKPPNSNHWQRKKSVKLASVRGLPVQTNKTHMVTYIKQYVHFTNNCRPRTESLRSVSSFTNTAKMPRHSSCSRHQCSVLLTAVHVKCAADNIQVLSEHFSFTLPISIPPVLHIHL